MRPRPSHDIPHNGNEPAEEEDPKHQHGVGTSAKPIEGNETECDPDDSTKEMSLGITFPIEIGSESIHERSQSNSHSTELNER